MPSRLLAYIVVSLALLTAARSHVQRRNVGTDTTKGSSSTEYDGQLNFDGTLLSITNMSDRTSNKMIKRKADRPFETVRLSRCKNIGYTWVGNILINRTERIEAVFATGTSNTWAHASKFSVEGLSPKSSFKGVLAGEVYEVPVTVAGIEVNTSIGHVTWVHDQAPFSSAVSGVLGLGISGHYFNARPFYELAIEQELVKPVFAFDAEKDNPEFHFGGVDKDRFDEAEVEWHVLVPFQESTGWVISKGNVDIGTDKGVLQGIVAIIDTGAPIILAPEAAVAKIHLGIAKSLWYKAGHQLLVPCNKVPQIIFRWGAGKPWELNHDHFISKPLKADHPVYHQRKEPMCIAAITIRKSYGWIINPVYLKGAYTIFDWGERRIGFGKVSKKKN